jgi:DNA-binding CsgD family transcriptional regulator
MKDLSNLLNIQEQTVFGLSFDLDVLNGKVVLNEALRRRLLHKDTVLNYNDFMAMLPEDEYTNVHRIHQMLLVFYNSQRELCYTSSFVLLHTLKRANQELKLLRQINFKIGATPMCHNLCLDVSNMQFSKSLQFDIQLPPEFAHRKEKWMKRFIPFLQPQTSILSKREIQVLSIWERVDSVSVAAQQMNISTRTLETHLRNVRQKLKVKRSMDAVLYAKGKGWI